MRSSLTRQSLGEARLEVLVEVLLGREGVVPHRDGRRVVQAEAQLRQRHVQLVHRGEVLAGLAVGLGAGAVVEAPLVVGVRHLALVLLLAHHLRKSCYRSKILLATDQLSYRDDLGSAMFGQQEVVEFALLVADGRYDVLGLLRHFIEEQVDHAQTSFPKITKRKQGQSFEFDT